MTLVDTPATPTTATGGPTLAQERRNSDDVIASAHLQLANVTRRLERISPARYRLKRAFG